MAVKEAKREKPKKPKILRGGLDPRSIEELRRAQAAPPDLFTYTYIRPVHPSTDIPCACAKCDLNKKWPGYYVGSVGLSWECFLEGYRLRPTLADTQPSRRVDYRGVRNDVKSATRHLRGREGFWASREDMRVRSKRRMWKAGESDMRDCEGGCDGLAEKGRRYCLQCETELRPKLISHGLTAEQIETWLNLGPWPGEEVS
jgi:hypothetical protein